MDRNRVDKLLVTQTAADDRLQWQSRKTEDESTLDTNNLGNHEKGYEKMPALWQARRLSGKASRPIPPLQTLPPSLQGKIGLSCNEIEKGSQSAFASWLPFVCLLIRS